MHTYEGCMSFGFRFYPQPSLQPSPPPSLLPSSPP
jgi:hypothetical protein